MSLTFAAVYFYVVIGLTAGSLLGLGVDVDVDLDAEKPSPPPQCSEGCFQFGKTRNMSCDCCNNDGPLTNPCTGFECCEGFHCELQFRSTRQMSDCRPGVVPLNPMCRMNCEKEVKCELPKIRVINTHGCPTCMEPEMDFIDPCTKAKACRKGSTCSLQQATCTKPPCNPLKRCCRKVNCPMNCLKYSVSDGCEKCLCCNECVNRRCPKGKMCRLMAGRCSRCPCPPRPFCV